MKQAFDTLCLNPEFKKRNADMEPRLAEPWDEAVKFFHRRGRPVRRRTHAAAAGRRPGCDADAGGAPLAMPFAGQILSVGPVKDGPQDQDYQQFLSSTFTLTVGAQKHALNVAHIIAAEFFLETQLRG